QKMVAFSVLDPGPTPATGAVTPKPAAKPASTSAKKP
ncbi:MAG: hypothetical protein QOG65_1144, partial [Actinomycetota bacterium]|nr:hypothetical protein [Actinomycetota bacterium]